MVNGTELPVVFGVNCSSAQFDIPGNPSFVERQVMKPDGGAFAGFGDTRVSPTWANNNMAFGFFDAMFPDVSTAFGAEDGTGRLGKILQSGKFFMATKNGVGYQSAAATYQEHYLYHLLGDPSAQVWAYLPKQIDVEKIDVDRIPVDGPGPPFRVLVNMGGQAAPRGAVVTLFQRGTPIGRAVVGAGAVEITPEVAEGTDDLSVAIEQDGSPPAQKAVESGPSGPLATTSSRPLSERHADEPGHDLRRPPRPRLRGRAGEAHLHAHQPRHAHVLRAHGDDGRRRRLDRHGDLHQAADRPLARDGELRGRQLAHALLGPVRAERHGLGLRPHGSSSYRPW